MVSLGIEITSALIKPKFCFKQMRLKTPKRVLSPQFSSSFYESIGYHFSQSLLRLNFFFWAGSFTFLVKSFYKSVIKLS